MSPILIPLLICLIFPICLLWAAVSDLKSMTIPNKLSITLAVAFLPAALLLGLSPLIILQHLGIGAAGLALGILAFAFRVMGGGDAKLIAATAMWFHPEGALYFVIYTALAGGALSIALLSGREFLQIYTPTMPKWLQTLLKPNGDIPYGLAICTGGLLAMPHSDLYPLLGF